MSIYDLRALLYRKRRQLFFIQLFFKKDNQHTLENRIFLFLKLIFLILFYELSPKTKYENFTVIVKFFL